MNHIQAYDTHAAERYLLGELSAEEAEDFELHYFECAQCAMAVDSGAEFVENARAVLGEENTQAPARQRRERERSAWAVWGWMRSPAFALPFAAAVLFGVFALYQETVISGLRHTFDSARVLPAFQLIGASRGEATAIRIPPGTPSFALSMDVPPDQHFGQYECVLSSGREKQFSVDAPAPAAGQPITILVPVKGLTPGNKEVTIYGLGADGKEAAKISDYTFDLQN